MTPTKGMPVRVAGRKGVFTYRGSEHSRSGGDVAVVIDADHKFRYFRADQVSPLCGRCTTRYDSTGKVPRACATCASLGTPVPKMNDLLELLP